MQRLKTRAQFQAVMAGSTVSRTAHFVLHRLVLDASVLPQPKSAVQAEPLQADSPTGPDVYRQQALFAVQDIWIGALVPKRWARRAVTRNTIKRQIYTVSALLDPPLPQAAHVVRLRAGFDRKQFISATSDVLKAAVRGELEQLFRKASA